MTWYTKINITGIKLLFIIKAIKLIRHVLAKFFYWLFLLDEARANLTFEILLVHVIPVILILPCQAIGGTCMLSNTVQHSTDRGNCVLT